jgi:hypothetical protein
MNTRPLNLALRRKKNKLAKVYNETPTSAIPNK